MNLKTTLILAVLVIAGGVAWLLLAARQADDTVSETLTVLDEELVPDKLTRIEVSRGDRLVLLEREPGQAWTLPGKWRVRKPEVDQLVRAISTLRTRFTPITLDDPPDLKRYGLDKEPLLVAVRAGGKDYTLAFADEPGESNRFSRPTYVRLDKCLEVVRLPPGLIAELGRPQDRYMQRRLFLSERLTKEDTAEKVEQLAAKAIAVKGPDGSYSLERTGADWELRAPFRDRPDPDKLQKILTAIPDIWAEIFVDKKDERLKDADWKDAVQTIRVTLADGDQQVTLLVGKQSQMKTRVVVKPAPPFGPPRPPQKQLVHEEYRFAKIAKNDQVFEIKADKLKDVLLSAGSLRDPRLARFRSEDARRLEIKQGATKVVLVKDKDKDHWRLEKPAPVDAKTGAKEPVAVDAEAAKVTELLDKLTGLEAKDADAIDKGDPKAYGLDKPAIVKVTLEETKGTGEAKTKQDREFTFKLGKHDTAKKKLYVQVRVKRGADQVTDWPRINAVDDGVLKLVERPALAYRNRKVLDFSSFDLAKIDVQPSGEAFTLEQVKNNWRLASPQADVDTSKADQLADLGRLEAVEFVADNAKTDDLDKLYGLAKPLLTAKFTFSDAKKPAQTLLIGKPRQDKQEYFARLASDPAIFIVKKETRDVIDRESLAYRPLQLWDLPAGDIAEVHVRKEDPQYELKRDGPAWKISGPFDAAALTDRVQPLTEALAKVSCERFVAHTAKDLGSYGLDDKPYLRVAVRPTTKKNDDQKEPKEKKKELKEDKKTKDDTKDRVLLIGKQVDKGKTRYARLGDGKAIFVLGEKAIDALDHSALDFLDPTLLNADAKSIQRIKKTGDGPWTLQQEKEEWKVVEGSAAPFAADKKQAAALADTLSNLRARRFAAYGPKVDLDKFGLKKPAITVVFTVQPPSEKDKPAKPVTHTLVLGQPVKGAPGERYARLDQGPGVAVLDAASAAELTWTYLDFVNHQLLKLDADDVTEIERRLGSEVLVLGKRDKNWRLLKPTDLAADQTILENLVRDLTDLRTQRIAAYPVKDAKALAEFGLGVPAAIVTVRLAGPGGKIIEHRLQIGKADLDKKAVGNRFVRVDNSLAVAVLPERLARQLLGVALQFRDRNLAKIDAADQIILERGSRKAVFAKDDDIWKMIEPVKTDAENADLEALFKDLSTLRADELVADRPADLKSYGLAPPQLRVRLGAEKKEVLTLLIGANEKQPDKSKARRYARLGTSDLVFLLSPDLTSRALRECRSRKVWSSLDKAQVEKLSFNYESHSFMLHKVDNKWQVEGKPLAKVKEDAVRDTLDLQVERYVVDRGGDLKLYGLQPPTLTLTAHTPSGERTLHIGNTVGDSKERYATVPGSEPGGIFVIREADAQRLVRNLPSFIEKGPAPKK